MIAGDMPGRRGLALAMLAAVMVATGRPAAQWPQFRGPNGTGVASDAGYPVEFSPAKNVVWRAAVPYGQSSPVIVGSRLYVTARDGEQLLTMALDTQTGRELWRRRIRRERAMEMYKANDPASPSPAADAGGVVVFFADVGLTAYSPEGAVRWTHPMGPFKNFYGMAASPIIAGGLVVQLIDQLTGSYLVALDRATGQVRWKTDRPAASIGYATPMVFRPTPDAADLITIGSTRLDSYDLATGEPRWWRPLATGGSMGTALADGDTLWVSTLGSNEPGLPQFATALAQYDTDKDGRLSAPELLQDKAIGEHFGWIDTSDDKFITEAEWNVARSLGMGAWGAIALKPGTARGLLPDDAVQWRVQKNVPYIPAPLVYQGVFYMVKTGGIVTTLDAATGTLLKEGRATGALGDYYASPVAADGKVYVTSQEGKVAVLKAGAQWDVLAVNDLGEEVNATPALAGGRLFVRTRAAVYCFR
jgi:outer membrane protein assembly factor BamB